MENGVEFYCRRAAEERRAMECAVTEEAKALHRALADSYAAKLRELGQVGKLEPAR